MKTIKILLLTVGVVAMSFTTLPIISWKSDTIDVGEIPQSIPKSITFEFKNTGKKEVIITNVQGSCGCTATAYTKTPIKGGTSGIVTATYNAANLGAFSKTVSVLTNADTTPKVLTLKGTVKAVVAVN